MLVEPDSGAAGVAGAAGGARCDACGAEATPDEVSRRRDIVDDCHALFQVSNKANYLMEQVKFGQTSAIPLVHDVDNSKLRSTRLDPGEPGRIRYIIGAYIMNEVSSLPSKGDFLLSKNKGVSLMSVSNLSLL